jgi:hypothetical protein
MVSSRETDKKKARSLDGENVFCPRGKAGFHFVPEGHAIVARRFIGGLAINRICVPEGRLKWDLGYYMAKRGKRDAFLTPE